MKVTIFKKNEQHTEVVKVRISHITIFNGCNVVLHFINEVEELKLIEHFIKEYVLFTVQGMHVTIVPETNNYQRVNFRFDND